jgi:hypothetical protein
MDDARSIVAERADFQTVGHGGRRKNRLIAVEGDW